MNAWQNAGAGPRQVKDLNKAFREMAIEAGGSFKPLPDDAFKAVGDWCPHRTARDPRAGSREGGRRMNKEVSVWAVSPDRGGRPLFIVPAPTDGGMPRRRYRFRSGSRFFHAEGETNELA